MGSNVWRQQHESAGSSPSLTPVKVKKIILPLIKMIRETLFGTIAIGVKVRAIGESDQAYFWIQQRARDFQPVNRGMSEWMANG